MSLAHSCLSLVDIIPASFHSQMLCDYLFLALGLWAPEPGLGLNQAPLFSGETVAAETSLQNLSHCLWEWGQPFPHLHPSYHLNVAFSLNPWL